MSTQENPLECIDQVQAALHVVEDQLAFFTQSPIEELVAELSPLEKAKAQVSLAYTINALLYVYLKTQGVSTKDIRHTHVKQELERVKTYIKKIKDTEALAKGPSVVLNKAASKRVIQNALSSDQSFITTKENSQNKTNENTTESSKETKTSNMPPQSKRRRKQ